MLRFYTGFLSAPRHSKQKRAKLQSFKQFDRLTSNNRSISSLFPAMARVSLGEDDLTELSLLRALEVDELVSSGLLTEEQRFNDNLLSILQFSYPEIKLQIFTGSTYPAEQLSFDIENLLLSRLVFDSLRIELRKILSADADTNDYERWCKREEGDAFESEMTVLHLVQKTVDFLETFRKPEEPDVLTGGNCKNDLIPFLGTDRTSFNFNAVALELLGKTPEEICEVIPECYRVLHVESVIRNDNYSDFLKCKSRIRQRIENNFSVEELRKTAHIKHHGRQRSQKPEMINYLMAPKLTFHGTPNRLVPNIVRYGFLRAGDLNPETGKRLEVRCGSTYGRGIYSSPSADFSLNYSGEDARPTTLNGFWGLKLIVCATIMGVSREMCHGDNWRNQSNPYPDADSHVGNRGLEYIVFDRTQILPCYVIHLDWGNDNRKHFHDVPVDPTKWEPKTHPKLRNRILGPGDKQRLKEELIAKAAKYFPYGYGPATGTSFVVEEVGEVDDDEEEYGDYQKARLDGVDGEGKSFWELGLGDVRKHERDEYTDALLGKRKDFKSEVINDEEE